MRDFLFGFCLFGDFLGRVHTSKRDISHDALSDALDDFVSTYVDEDYGLFSNRLQQCMIDEAPYTNPDNLEFDDSDSNQ